MHIYKDLYPLWGIPCSALGFLIIVTEKARDSILPGVALKYIILSQVGIPTDDNDEHGDDEEEDRGNNNKKDNS